MRTLIFEPQFVGHNLVYVRHLVGALKPLGVEVTLLTSRQASESEEFAKHLGEIQESFHVEASDMFENSKKHSGVRVNGPSGLFSSMRALLDGLKSTKPDHLYIPFGNPLAHAMGFPNPITRYLYKERIESEIILLFGKYAYRHQDIATKAKQQIALQLLANGPWTRIHHIVPYAIDVMRAHRSRLSETAHLLADPVEPPIRMSKSQARALLGLDPKYRYTSLVGLIDQRKGVGDLLAAALLLQDPNHRILLAGKNSPEARLMLASQYRRLVDSGKVVVLDRHLSNREMWAACIASDLITTPYPHHQYSASILIRAAAVGVPVLANRIGWMEDVTHRYDLGWTCDTTDAAAFAAILETTLQHADSYLPTTQSRQFVEFHTLANFQSQITQRIRDRIRLTASIPDKSKQRTSHAKGLQPKSAER